MGERIIDPKFNIQEVYRTMNILNPYRFGGGAEASPIVSDGKVLEFDFGGGSWDGIGTTVTDLSPSGYNGVVSGALAYSSENGGASIHDGNNEHIEVSGSGLSPLTGGFTVELFVKTDNLLYDGFFASSTVINEPIYGISMLNTEYFTGSAFVVDRISNPGIVANQWVHTVFRRTDDGTTLSIVNNGIVFKTSAPFPVRNLERSVYHIGKGYKDAGGTYAFSGKIGVVRMYNRYLSTAEINQNFDAQRDRYLI